MATQVHNGAFAATGIAGRHHAGGSDLVTTESAVHLPSGSMSLSPGALEFSALGDTLRLGAEAVDANDHTVVGAVVTWAMGDTTVASVDSTGLVLSLGNGQADVTATADSVSGTAEVTVAQVVSSVRVSPDTVAFSALGDTVRVTAEAFDANGHPVAMDAFAWATGDTTVAVVDAFGLVRSVGNGEAVVTVTADAVSGSAHVTVRQKARAVAVIPAADTLRMDDTLRLAAQAFDANGHEIADDTRQFAWTSSHARIAEVDDSGLVAGIREGQVTITAAMDSASASADVRVTNPDRAALRALYEATDGPNWQNSEHWMTDTPLGTWYGVRTSDRGRVELLVLRNNGLKGTIPLEIWTLDKARQLWLSTNQLHGTLPPEIGNLTSLEGLYLYQNRLEGAIPPEIGKLTLLKELVLASNDLAGIPPEIGNLTRLHTLWMAFNSMAGTQIPTELGNLVNLERLLLQYNGFDGPIPSSLGNLENLRILFLHNNQLSGPVPPEIGRLKSLETMSLAHNKLTELPNTMDGLVSLTEAYLNNNQLSGPVPPSIGNLESLETLHLMHNNLTALPNTMDGLVNLKEAHLHDNELAGTI